MTTTIGQEIIDLLSMTHSVARLVEFLRDRECFNECASIDDLKPGYIYMIYMDKWMNATGIDAKTLSTRWADTDALPPTYDGRIWVDHYFERNKDGEGYQEDEGPRYVFISLNDYNGEFDDDECAVPLGRSASNGDDEPLTLRRSVSNA
jgi:hypothetical protein